MALRPRLSPGVPLSRWVATVGSGTAAVKHLLLTVLSPLLEQLPTSLVGSRRLLGSLELPVALPTRRTAGYGRMVPALNGA